MLSAVTSPFLKRSQKITPQTYQLLPFAGQGSNTYYPAFMPNGHVMFLQMKGDGFEYVEVDLSQARSIPATQIDSIKKLNSDDFAH